MARKSKHQIQMERIEAAMAPLVGMPQFAEYIAMLGDLKDEAVSFMVESDTVKSERDSLVVKGEVRAYLNQINIYKGQIEQLEAQAQAAQQVGQD